MPRLALRHYRGAGQRRRGDTGGGLGPDDVADLLDHDNLLEGQAARLADHPDTFKNSAKASRPASGNRLKSAAQNILRPGPGDTYGSPGTPKVVTLPHASFA